jgi:hypothetical protein
LYDAGLMLWEEFDRPGAARAFRVIRPDELQAEYWFELEPAEGPTVLRHVIEGCTAGKYEAIWRERIEPLHNLILEALLDNVQITAMLGGLNGYLRGVAGRSAGCREAETGASRATSHTVTAAVMAPAAPARRVRARWGRAVL